MLEQMRMTILTLRSCNGGPQTKAPPVATCFLAKRTGPVVFRSVVDVCGRCGRCGAEHGITVN